jgi:hypothetical protein
MAKAKKKRASNYDSKVAIKGTFADVIKVSVTTDQGAKKTDKKAAKKKK